MSEGADDDDGYEACSIRARRTKREMEKIKAAIYDVVSDDPPMTVRQTFYQLVVRGVIEKSEREYQLTVIRLISDMRLSGELPFDWIVDESRRRRITETHDNVTEALEACAKFYRRSALREADDYVEVWCEKDALAGLLWDVVSDYDVPLMVSRGMPSLTFLHGTAQEICRAHEAGKRTFIYQFGDHDPSGVIIPRTIEARLRELCEKLDCEPPTVTRAALTPEQIRLHRLPTRPTKRAGNRHAKGFKGRSVELDALPPHVLREMVSQIIEQHIPAEVVATLRAAEESERSLLNMFASQLPEAFRETGLE
jgi:hypothetical protein